MRFLIGGCVVLMLLSTAVLPSVTAILMEIPSSGTKCVSEDIHSNIVVLADYGVIGDEEHHLHVIPTISAKVTSPYGNNLHHNENVTHGQFSFTTTEAGNYLACFWVGTENKTDKPLTISLDWRTGINAKDWASVAKKEHIEGLELELTKLEGLVEAIHQSLTYLKEREIELREVSEKTNSRVAWFSIMALGVCVVVSGLQIWYLKTYFRKKKLI